MALSERAGRARPPGIPEQRRSGAPALGIASGKPGTTRDGERKHCMRRLTTVLAAASIMALGTVLGCAGDEQERGALATTTEHRLSGAEVRQLAEAEQVLIKKCMTRHGFPYWVSVPLTAEESRPLGYVLDDVGWAAEHGYGGRIQEKLGNAYKRDRNVAHRNSLTGHRRSAYDAALFGTRDTAAVSARIPGGGTIRSRLGGCELEAKEELYGDYPTWFRADKIATNLTPLYASDLMADERFGAALREWSRCMRRSGHVYATPGEARAAVPRLTQGIGRDKAFAVERDLAVADATCARAADLKTVGRKVEASHLDAMRERYGEALATHDRLQQAALAKAADLAGPHA